MIALDLDGTLLNYGATNGATRVNVELIDSLPAGAPVAIVTNQGGMVWSINNPQKYPTPERVARRLAIAITYLEEHGHQVSSIHICVYHPKASGTAFLSIMNALIAHLHQSELTGWVVYMAATARKPEPQMLLLARATVYYGDSPDDELTAQNAGIEFVAVTRFE